LEPDRKRRPIGPEQYWKLGEVVSHSWLSIAVTEHYGQSLGRGMVYFILLFLHLSGLIVGSQGRNLEAKTEAEAMRKCFFLVCSSCFLIHFRTTCPGVELSIAR
jgi:K+-transporting ATPase A subunit